MVNVVVPHLLNFLIFKINTYRNIKWGKQIKR